MMCGFYNMLRKDFNFRFKEHDNPRKRHDKRRASCALYNATFSSQTHMKHSLILNWLDLQLFFENPAQFN